MGIIPSFTLDPSQEMIIIVLAVAYALFAIAIQRKLSNAKRLREIQAQISKTTKEMNLMMKNKVPEAEIVAKQKEMMPLLGESMRSSMKPMFVILPMFLIVYYLLIPKLPLGPSATPKSIQDFFFIVVFVVGIISAIVMMLYDKQQTKKTEKALEGDKAAVAQKLASDK
jgi:uncharacterized membrane protein (DUF106 family)